MNVVLHDRIVLILADLADVYLLNFEEFCSHWVVKESALRKGAYFWDLIVLLDLVLAVLAALFKDDPLVATVLVPGVWAVVGAPSFTCFFGLPSSH